MFLVFLFLLFMEWRIKCDYLHFYQRPNSTECFFKEILKDHPVLHFKLTVLQPTPVFYLITITNDKGYKIYNNTLKVTDSSFHDAAKVRLENVEAGEYKVCFASESSDFVKLAIDDHHHTPLIFKDLVNDNEVKKLTEKLTDLNNRIDRFKELLYENKIKQQHHNYLGGNTDRHIRYYFWLEVIVLVTIVIYQVNEWKKALNVKRTVKLQV